METELFQTLETLRHLRAFNAWMFERLKPHLGERILEIGCGLGTFTPWLMEHGRVTAVDPSSDAVRYVAERIPHAEELDLREGSITDEATVDALEPRYDTALMVNVLEHIEEQGLALANAHRLLAPGGRLIVLSPWGPRLWGSLDEAFGHVRRYTRGSLRTAMQQGGFEVISLKPFNTLGIVGWLFAGKLLRHTRLESGPTKLYSLMFPVARLLEDLIRPPIGLSLIAVGVKR
ncbi:MAG TPA: class I SAM-dependent methyltransferase [Actinomycetota bacterium]|nr:class I SAM-dependent methyltransferase [Actinomycetota bacterium]